MRISEKMHGALVPFFGVSTVSKEIGLYRSEILTISRR